MNRLKLICIGLSLIALPASLMANDETRSCSSTLSPFCCTPFESCMKIEGRLNEIKADLNACCANLLSRCAIIRSKVGNPCDQGIPVDQAFMNNPMRNPITQSGVYCLAENVSGSLVINADDVIIVMNNHTISGTTTAISVTGNIFNLRKDIAILGAGVVTASTTAGMSFTNCSNIVVDGVSFESNVVGCTFDNTSGIRLNSNSFTGHTTVALQFLNGSNNGKITCCTLRDNPITTAVDTTCTIGGNSAGAVLYLSSAQNLVFSNVAVNNNSFSGNEFRPIDVCQSTNCFFDNCSVNANTAGSVRAFFFIDSIDCTSLSCTADVNVGTNNTLATPTVGFYAVDGVKINFVSCAALNNESNGGATPNCLGFALEGFVGNPNACCIKHCLAKGNAGDPARPFNSAYLALNATNCYFENNIAIGNDARGYLLSGGSNVVFLGNYAEANGTNYSGIPGPITTFDISLGTFSPVRPSIWQNIDAIP